MVNKDTYLLAGTGDEDQGQHLTPTNKKLKIRSSDLKIGLYARDPNARIQSIGFVIDWKEVVPQCLPLIKVKFLIPNSIPYYSQIANRGRISAARGRFKSKYLTCFWLSPNFKLLTSTYLLSGDWHFH